MPTPETTVTFRDLIAPLTPEDFFADYYGKRAVHIPGDAAKIQHLFDWSSFNRLINMTTLWNARTMKMAMDGRNLAQSISHPPIRHYHTPSTEHVAHTMMMT